MISVEWKSGNWRRRMLLDPSRQLVPVLIENSMDYPGAVRESSGFLQSCESRAAPEWSMRDGMMTPTRIDIRSWVELTDGRKKVRAEESVEVVKCQRVRVEPPAEVFRLEFPDGTPVSLTDVGAGYTVGGDPLEQAEGAERALEQRKIDATQRQEASESSSPRRSRDLREDGYASEPDKATVAWYSQKWVWVIVMAVAGIAIISIGYARRDRKQ